MSTEIFNGVSSVDPLFHERIVYQPHEDKIYRQLTQRNTNAILERNAELRKEDNQKNLDWGRMVGSVPFQVWDQWVKQYPEIRGNDRGARDRIIIQLLKENPQYSVVPKHKL